MAGRKPFEPTSEHRMTVSLMAASGFPQKQIVERIINPGTGKGIDLHTLEKHFREELDAGMETANAIVAQSLFKKATGNGPQSVTAAIFWLKCRAGWKPVEGMEITGKDGSPLGGVPSMTQEQYERIAQKLDAEV